MVRTRVWPGLVVPVLLLTISAAAGQEPRRVFVLHSGMHVILAPADKDHAARTMKELFARRGIRERDLVFLDSPFPTATFKDPIPRTGLVIYLESADPASRSAHEGYLRLHKALQNQGVGRDDAVVWIGHSAGGQMGMSMAHLAHHLDRYPDLARKTQPYRFDTVITLGSAVGSNPVPENVKLRHYYSAGDTMIYLLSRHGNVVSESMKSKVVFRPCVDLKANGKVRVFCDVEHPNWYSNDDVLAAILREFETHNTPFWRRPHADVSVGVGLSQVIANALDAQLGISLEEPNH